MMIQLTYQDQILFKIKLNLKMVAFTITSNLLSKSEETLTQLLLIHLKLLLKIQLREITKRKPKLLSLKSKLKEMNMSKKHKNQIQSMIKKFNKKRNNQKLKVLQLKLFKLLRKLHQLHLRKIMDNHGMLELVMIRLELMLKEL